MGQCKMKKLQPQQAIASGKQQDQHCNRIHIDNNIGKPSSIDTKQKKQNIDEEHDNTKIRLSRSGVCHHREFQLLSYYLTKICLI